MRTITAMERLKKGLLTGAAAAVVASCGIYDDTSGCETDLRLKLVYDYNMKYADATAHEVRTAHVYAYDESGSLVLNKVAEIDEASAQDGAYVEVNELETGTAYDFLIWAEGEAHEGGYDYGDASAEETLTAKVRSTGGISGEELTPLFHGRVDGRSFAEEHGITQTVEIPLTKNTNSIKVMLQEMTGGAGVSADDFEMEITDGNGFLGYDDEPLDGGDLTYEPYDIRELEAETNGETGETTGALMASFSVNRLMAGHDVRLTVRRTSGGETVLSLPLVQYFLLFKDSNEGGMTDQEYLDREDTWSLTFFLTSGGKWLSSCIYVNGWRLVLQNTDF